MKTTKTTQNASKFADQTTHVVGRILNRETFESEAFELDVPYCRAESVAVKHVAEALGISTDDYMVVIAKDGIQNEAAARWRYDYPSLVQAAHGIFEELEDAETTCVAETGSIVVEIPRYVYSAQLWIVVLGSDGEPVDYYTTRHKCESFQKFTKGDARSFVCADRDELYSDEFVLGYHAPKRDEFTSYAVVNSDKAKACRKYADETDES